MKVVQREKLFVVFALLFILGGVVFPSFISRAAGGNGNVSKTVTKENKDFKVSAEYGIDGFAVYDYPAVVQVTLESNQNFTGMLRIVPSMDYGQKTVAYGEDISMAAGEAKTFTLVPSNLGSSGKVSLEILDEKDHVLYAETDRIKLGNIGTSVMVGVLSDDYSALNYFDGISVTCGNYQGITSALELTLDSFPEESTALSVLNYIIIDNYDTANLSEKQYRALKDWVNNGGVLILSLGANYQNVLHTFSDDFITGTLGNLEKKDLNWNVQAADNVETEKDEEEEQEETEKDDAQKADSFSLQEADAITFEWDGAEEMSDFSEDQTAYKKATGSGAVVILSYSLGMEPVTSYKEKGTVAKSLIQEAAVLETESMLNGMNYGGSAIYNMTSLAKVADDTKKPSALLYGGLLFLYVIIVGPVLYLLLKAVKKREKIWVAIPIVALVFTGCIYLTGFIYRVRKPIVNTCSVVTLEGDNKTESVYTSITCPKAREYTIKIKGGYSGFQGNMNDYYYGLFSNDSSDDSFDYLIKKKNDGTEIVMNNAEAFSENSFLISGTDENDIGTVDYDLKCYTTGFEGTVTNNTKYDLKNVVINFENHLYQAGDLKKGEQAVVDSSKLFDSVGYGAFENIYMSMNNTYTDRRIFINYRVDTTMEESFVRVKNYNHGCIWAIIDSYEPEMTDGSETKQNGFGVIFQPYTAEYEDVAGVYYPNIMEMAVEDSGAYDQYDPTDGMMNYGYNDVAVTYSFENYPGITTLENADFGKPAPRGYGVYADVYAYNAETGDYDMIFTDKATLSGEELAKYVNGNILILKYEVKDPEQSNYMPRIIARGDE